MRNLLDVQNDLHNGISVCFHKITDVVGNILDCRRRRVKPCAFFKQLLSFICGQMGQGKCNCLTYLFGGKFILFINFT